MRHSYEAEQWLPYPIQVVFAFFGNPENLPRLMPKWQKARIEEAVYAPAPRPPANHPALKMSGIVAGVGSTMTISFRPFPFSPLRVPWDAEITEFEWDDHFCDVQHRGPFAYWRHCHRLVRETRSNGRGEQVTGTLLRDALEYEMYFGDLGEIAHTLFVKRQVRSIFDYRHKRTEELLALMAGRRPG
jgi:ligand-binding SRPBCC domain-containing protein